MQGALHQLQGPMSEPSYPSNALHQIPPQQLTASTVSGQSQISAPSQNSFSPSQAGSLPQSQQAALLGQQVSGTPLKQMKIIQVGLILQLIAAQGDQIPCMNADIMTPFHSHEVPNINILLYYVVVSHNAGLHDAQAPTVLVLMERLCQTAAQKGLPIIINSYTVHRLILTTVLITSKMFNDTYYTNKYIA